MEHLGLNKEQQDEVGNLRRECLDRLGMTYLAWADHSVVWSLKQILNPNFAPDESEFPPGFAEPLETTFEFDVSSN